MKRFAALLVLAVLLCSPAALGEESVPVVTEIMASNGVYVNGHAYDWVEIYNPGAKTADLSGWYLSDSKKNPWKWAFPEGTKLKAGAYLLVYCTGDDSLAPGKDGTYYANFKLSAKGDQVFLTRPNGQAADAVVFPKQYGNVSWGVAADGTWGYFAAATPGKANEKQAYALRADTPRALTAGGFYEGTVTARFAGTAGDTLRYTLDGSAPTEKSPVLPEEGLSLNKTACIRVAAFHPDKVPSQPVGVTYLIDDPSPVAVVCLTTDEKYLFNKKTGALVRGSGSTPNYEKELEYPVNIEYFDETGACLLNQMGTFTPAGHSALQNSQKSIAVFARKAYGADRFSFNPFPNRDYTSYKSLLLRSTNSDAFSTRLRDAVFTSLAENLDILYQDARPIQVYINGEYYGHYNLREKINKYFVAQWEGVEDEDAIDQIDLLARTGSDKFINNGDNADWLALCDFCKTQDLNVGDNLQYVTDRLDVDSLFTHAAFEIICGNNDITNVRMYRVPGGKWKYVLFDVEAGFLSLDAAPLENYIKPVSAKIQAFRHEPLNALLNVPDMRDRFLRRFAQVLETAFQWPYVESKFQPWEDILTQLLPRQNKRWPYLTMEEWRQNVNAVKYYARVRPKKIVSLLAKRMKLTDQEVETYFGDVQRLLDQVNTLPKE